MSVYSDMTDVQTMKHKPDINLISIQCLLFLLLCITTFPNFMLQWSQVLYN